MNHTIAAIATPQAAGGIGVIRISGPKALQIADAVFRRRAGCLWRNPKATVRILAEFSMKVDRSMKPSLWFSSAAQLHG